MEIHSHSSLPFSETRATDAEEILPIIPTPIEEPVNVTVLNEELDDPTTPPQSPLEHLSHPPTETSPGWTPVA